MSISTGKIGGGEGPAVDRENLLFLDLYSPEVTSIVEFRDEFYGRLKPHAGY